jgi:hypothetical protein
MAEFKVHTKPYFRMYLRQMVATGTTEDGLATYEISMLGSTLLAKVTRGGVSITESMSLNEVCTTWVKVMAKDLEPGPRGPSPSAVIFDEAAELNG